MKQKKNKKSAIASILITALTIFGIYFFIYQEKKPVTPAIEKTPVVQKSTQKFPIKVGRSKKVSFPEEVKGKIVTLKKLKNEYAFDYYKLFSKKVREGLQFPKKITFGYVERRVSFEVDEIKAGRRIVYAIWDNNEDRMAGTIQIRNKDKRDPGQLGMWLNEHFWGGGRIQEALLLISKTYFDVKPNENGYIAYVRPWNMRSRKTLLKFGFKKIDETTYDDEIAEVFEVSKEKVNKKTSAKQ